MRRRVAKKRAARELYRLRKWARQWKDRAWHVVEYVELWKQEKVHADQMAVIDGIEQSLSAVWQVIQKAAKRDGDITLAKLDDVVVVETETVVHVEGGARIGGEDGEVG